LGALIPYYHRFWESPKIALIPYYRRFSQIELFGFVFDTIVDNSLSTIVLKTKPKVRFVKTCGNMGLVRSLGSPKTFSSGDQYRLSSGCADTKTCSQKRHTTKAKETYYRGKRDLLWTELGLRRHEDLLSKPTPHLINVFSIPAQTRRLALETYASSY
jgi:hypothetical protein